LHGNFETFFIPAYDSLVILSFAIPKYKVHIAYTECVSLRMLQ
jgi:hypothetical protein